MLCFKPTDEAMNMYFSANHPEVVNGNYVYHTKFGDLNAEQRKIIENQGISLKLIVDTSIIEIEPVSVRSPVYASFYQMTPFFDYESKFIKYETQLHFKELMATSEKMEDCSGFRFTNQFNYIQSGVDVWDKMLRRIDLKQR